MPDKPQEKSVYQIRAMFKIQLRKLKVAVKDLLKAWDEPTPREKLAKKRK